MARMQASPPPRKAPGLIGGIANGAMQLVCWLLASLLLSIVIEWLGMRTLWQEEGADHARQLRNADLAYLSASVNPTTWPLAAALQRHTTQISTWLEQYAPTQGNTGQARSGIAQGASPENNPVGNHLSALRHWATHLVERYSPECQAALYITQSFVIRLTLILLSLPIFGIAATVGIVDGLVERDLRRWGGGRESSHVFNLARRSIIPVFVGACVIYISLPVSLHPVVILLPFAVVLGVATRVASERLKKYF